MTARVARGRDDPAAACPHDDRAAQTGRRPGRARPVAAQGHEAGRRQVALLQQRAQRDHVLMADVPDRAAQRGGAQAFDLKTRQPRRMAAPEHHRAHAARGSGQPLARRLANQDRPLGQQPQRRRAPVECGAGAPDGDHGIGRAGFGRHGADQKGGGGFARLRDAAEGTAAQRHPEPRGQHCPPQARRAVARLDPAPGVALGPDLDRGDPPPRADGNHLDDAGDRRRHHHLGVCPMGHDRIARLHGIARGDQRPQMQPAIVRSQEPDHSRGQAQGCVRAPRRGKRQICSGDVRHAALLSIRPHLALLQDPPHCARSRAARRASRPGSY